MALSPEHQVDEMGDLATDHAPNKRTNRLNSVFQRPKGELSKMEVAVIRQLRKNLKTVEGEKVLLEERQHQKQMRHMRSLVWSQMEDKDAVDQAKLEWLFSLYDIQDLGLIDE